jgi:uncharacterized tellurite resistance protein B-like protein
MSQNLTPLQNLHYAIGELAYAIARADGKVQKEERWAFRDMVAHELENKNYAFDISAIIFNIMEKDQARLPDSYYSAIKQIQLNSHYFSPEIKRKFISVIEKVAAAYPPVTDGESHLISKFKKDIEHIEGDPVFYGNNQ